MRCAESLPRASRVQYIALWNIFLTPGRWEELVNKTTWAIPTTNNLRDVGGPWLWPAGTDPAQIDSVYLAKWLGAIGCITPDRARDRIEPYALRRNTGTYYSAVAQEAHQRAAEQRERRRLAMGIAPSSTNPTPRLAACLSMAPVASSPPSPAPPSSIGPAPPPLAAPSLGACDHPSDTTSSNVALSVVPAAPPNPAPTPMDVDTPPAAETLLSDVDTSEIYQDHDEAP